MKPLPESWVSRAAERKSGRVVLTYFLPLLLGAGQAPTLAGPLAPLVSTPPTVLDGTEFAATPELTDPAQGTPQHLSLPLDLATNPKLLNANAVLAAFAAGASDTAVIVTLQPTVEAMELAVQSEFSPNRPEDLASAAAPVFYDLRDPAIRTRLQATVTQAVGQAIQQLNLPGLTVTQRFAYQFGFAARVTPAALERLLAHPAVLRVEPDGVLEPHLRQGIPLMHADTPSATYNGSGMSIAICDTGIDTAHPRLGGGGNPIFNAKVIGGYDTGDNDPDPRPDSITGHAHGTACAGIAAGDLGDSGDYIGGVAPGAKLYAIKISPGTSGSAPWSSMIAGWEWTITHQHDDPAHPILIISTSFGGGSYAGTCDTAVPAMTTAAANAVAAGITLFASSGNDGYCASMGLPACISYVNSVGAVYDANFGTYTPCVNADSCATKTATTSCATGYYVSESTVADRVTAYSNSASFLTLFAPANQAYTADIVGPGGYSAGDFTPSFGGTSAACPYAAGAAAVLQSAAKAKTGSYLTPAQVKTYLTAHGDTLTDGKITSVQKPRINLASAVAALSSVPFNDVPASSWAYAYIHAIRDAGITGGCGNGNYCPQGLVTREQMAAFLVRAVEGEPAANYCGGSSSFSDVAPDAWSCRYIKRLSELNITGGCGGGNYCPQGLVTREQMAAFIVRAVAGEPALDYCGGVAPFQDVAPSNFFCRYIKRLVELSVTQGCGNGNYCPGNEVNREQMAAFLARAFLSMK